MWVVGNRPSLADAIYDIDQLVDHCRALADEHKIKLNRLYRAYHLKGYATLAELAPLDDVKGIIKEQYKYKMKGAQTLGYIRHQLNKSVTKCPLCGINETHQLDHFMNKADYGQLACCRLNLVPTCGICNWLKHDGTYTDYVHAYYDKFPNVDFLITTITIKNNHVGMRFSIDQNAIGNPDLARRANTQFVNLNLSKRLHKAGIAFLNELVSGYSCTTNKELQVNLLFSENHYKGQNGRNDWRTSIIRGLRQNPAFDIGVLNALRGAKTGRMENGGGA